MCVSIKMRAYSPLAGDVALPHCLVRFNWGCVSSWAVKRTQSDQGLMNLDYIPLSVTVDTDWAMPLLGNSGGFTGSGQWLQPP